MSAALGLLIGPALTGCHLDGDDPPRQPETVGQPGDPTEHSGPADSEEPIAETPADPEGPGIAEPDADPDVYVDASAGDDENTGTRECPVRTIGRGVEIAAARAGADVYVAHGTYAERVALAEGVSVSGGYDPAAGWERDPSGETVIDARGETGPAFAFRGEDIRLFTRISGFTLIASGAGVQCGDCAGLVVEDVTISRPRVSDPTHPKKGALRVRVE